MHQGIATPGVIVALHVVTVTRMAAQNHHAVSTILEGFEDKERIDPPRTGDTNDAQRGRIPEPTGTRQVGSGIATPSTEKANDLRFIARLVTDQSIAVCVTRHHTSSSGSLG
jgi:hypothetical protein